MTAQVDQWTDEVADQVLVELTARELPLTPKQVLIHEDTDLLGEDAWRLVLVLPAPDGETWDRLEVFTARRTAVDLFDQLASASGHELPGATIASITTDEASEAETAPDDEPEEGEDPGRGS